MLGKKSLKKQIIRTRLNYDQDVRILLSMINMLKYLMEKI